MNHLEHKIQVAGVKKCRDLIPICRTNLFAIPNGGARSAKTGADLKKEGVLRGVFDLFLAVPHTDYQFYEAGGGVKRPRYQHGLWIEVKTPKRYALKNHGMSPEQIKFQTAMSAAGYATAVVCTADGIFDAVKGYMG